MRTLELILGIIAILAVASSLLKFVWDRGQRNGKRIAREDYWAAPQSLDQSFHGKKFYLVRIFPLFKTAEQPDMAIIEVTFEQGSDRTYLFLITERLRQMLLVDDESYGTHFKFLAGDSNLNARFERIKQPVTMKACL